MALVLAEAIEGVRLLAAMVFRLISAAWEVFRQNSIRSGSILRQSSRLDLELKTDVVEKLISVVCAFGNVQSNILQLQLYHKPVQCGSIYNATKPSVGISSKYIKRM